MTGLPIGATIGILGDGQLGRMLAGAAAKLGFDVSVFGPQSDSPSSRVARSQTVGAYTDLAAVVEWACACDVVPYEFENVPVETVQALEAAGVLVRPGVKALEVAQDRVIEKTFLRSCDIPTAEFAPVSDGSGLESALSRFGRGILKTNRDGYDGKGQVRLSDGDNVSAAFASLGQVPCILEAFVPFQCEISVIIARSLTGDVAIWDSPENRHERGILRRSIVPASVESRTLNAAQTAATRLIEALDYVGVLALEFFVLSDGRVLANEFAPRVHNSGHWTPEACATGQFEQHIRAVAGWPIGPVTRFHDVEMVNLLGEEALDIDRFVSSGASVTLYGKREALDGRKMGHVVRRVQI